MTNEQIKRLTEDMEHILKLKKDELDENIRRQFTARLYGMQDVVRVLGYEVKYNYYDCTAEIFKKEA